jgi:uncharacterized delta-60 repeat protein
MKKSIGSVFLAFMFLIILLSGCAPASTPVPPTLTPLPPTETPVPPTATSIPSTNTPIPTATPTALPLFIPGANNSVNTMVLQSDGKLVVGGKFTKLNGEPRNYIARLNPDRTLDAEFNPVADGQVNALALQPDGKLVVGGEFKNLGEEPRKYIARLNPDGTLDAEFNPGATFIDVGSDNAVQALVVQPDGKILVGGWIYSVDGSTFKNFIMRFNPDGTFDASFNTDNPNGGIYALALQPDGKIIVGGGFYNVGNEDRLTIARLNPDGTLDIAFNPGMSFGKFSVVLALAIQADNKILVGGPIIGSAGGAILRLNTDGTLDDSFNPGMDGSAYTLALQSDGKILVGGATFTTLIGKMRKGIGRLNADGTFDDSFNPEITGEVRVEALIVQPDGKIIVGGFFNNLNGETRDSIAGLDPDGTLEDATLIP